MRKLSYKLFIWVAIVSIVVIALLSQENELTNTIRSSPNDEASYGSQSVAEYDGTLTEILEPKRSEQECNEMWMQLQANPNPLMMIESGRVTIQFMQSTSYEEAMAFLEANNLEKDRVIEIFPLGVDRPESERYEGFHAIKIRTTAGQEVEVACEISQNIEVKDASPSLTLDQNLIAQ